MARRRRFRPGDGRHRRNTCGHIERALHRRIRPLAAFRADGALHPFHTMAEYFDVDHARAIAALDARFTARTEWPTWLLIVAIYGGWLAVLLLVRAGHLSLGPRRRR
jgi:hypothetical protein